MGHKDNKLEDHIQDAAADVLGQNVIDFSDIERFELLVQVYLCDSV